MRACCFKALQHGSLWLKIGEEFNISALVDSSPACYIPSTDALRPALNSGKFSNIFQHGGPRFKKLPHLTRPTMGSPLENTRALINNFVSLMRSLLTSIPLATDKDRIYAVMNSPEGKYTWHTINKCFDVLFGEDCCDSTGQLHHICHGHLSMDKVCDYLSTLNIGSVLATIKLVHLQDLFSTGHKC